MLINQVPFEEKHRKIITDTIPEPKDVFRYQYDVEYMTDLKLKYPKMTEKNIFIKIFGKQLLCKDYITRNWIWTFSTPDKSSTIYCLVDKNLITWNYDKRSSSFDDVVSLRQLVENSLI